jgi:hypothetical protein
MPDRPEFDVAARSGVGVTDGHNWILPAVIAGGWGLSWFGPRALRWGLLTAATVCSILCFPITLLTPVTPVSPSSSCRAAMECMSGGSALYWIMNGLIGFACCIVLSMLTLAIETIVAALGWASRHRF